MAFLQSANVWNYINTFLMFAMDVLVWNLIGCGLLF